MTFWSAENFCKAQGRRAVNLVDLGITAPTGNGCGKTEPPVCAEVNWDALRSALGMAGFWTGTSTASCTVWYFSQTAAQEAIRHGGRYGSATALCI